MDNRNELGIKLSLAMARHDWYYDMSDDFGAWTAGKNSYHHICDLFADLDKVDPEYARQVWNERAPKGWRFN